AGIPPRRSRGRAFGEILDKSHRPPPAVIFLDIPEEEILDRITGRLTCPNKECPVGTYHIRRKPPRVDELCDVCQTKLERRADDSEEKVRARLVAYHRETEVLVPYYREKGLLREVDGQGDIEAIYQRLM